MRRLVVDASIVLKWFVSENLSAEAVRLLDSRFLLCAPDLLVTELANALWKKVQRSQISRKDAAAILLAVEVISLEVFRTRPLVASAFDLAVHLKHPVYDSVYLALAIAQECALVTADKRFHSVVAQSELSHHVAWIEDEL